MIDLEAIELEYDLLTERSTDQEYAAMLQNIPDLTTRIRELEADNKRLDELWSEMAQRNVELSMRLESFRRYREGVEGLPPGTLTGESQDRQKLSLEADKQVLTGAPDAIAQRLNAAAGAGA